MNNGDSFHNGPENLELQRQNRLGLYNQSSDPAGQNTSDAAGTSPSSSSGSIRVTAGTTGPAPRSTPVSAASLVGSVGTKNAVQTPYYGDPVENSSGYDENEERAYRNKFNVASLALGISAFAGNLLCLFCLTPFAAILAIIFGCVGRVGGKFDGKGLTGLILGIVYFALFFLLIAFVILLAAMGEVDTSTMHVA